jgi:predicted XRE-type DNA-binding protein
LSIINSNLELRRSGVSAERRHLEKTRIKQRSAETLLRVYHSKVSTRIITGLPLTTGNRLIFFNAPS